MSGSLPLRILPALPLLTVLGCGGEAPPTVELPYEVRELRVPFDESGGSGATLPMRYFYANQTEQAAPPVLVFQFGGPGSSAVEYMPYVQSILPEWLTRRYALVGLDEIGVGGSVPIRCADLLMSTDAAFQHPFLSSTPEALLDAWGDATTACRESYGYRDLINTERHARDLDRLRVELGAEQLDFMAYSYGARVALTYAVLFPERAGRLVLDSSVDPRANYLDVLGAQALARATMVTRFLDWCEAEGECAFERQDFLQALTDLEAFEPDAALEFLAALGDLLFEPRWPQLAQAFAVALEDLEAALANPATRLVAPPAFIGTICADTSTYAETRIELQQAEFFDALDSELPESFFADTFNTAYACLFWPAHTSTITWSEVLADGGPDLEVLFVRSSGDPKSPAPLADSLAESVQSGFQIRVDEVSHAISLQNVNTCVDDAIQGFLVDGVGAAVLDCPKSAYPEP
ncbi:MAG: alpha/beta hydrolase [Deltaproteobacteria bacterium]|nr:alpha/beta hydrolase [Deltaproteobacteria bacterium]